MNTNEMLALLQVHADGMNIDGPNGLLFFLNTAQSILTRQSAEQNVVYDSTTGRLPTLDTQDEVYEYSAPEEFWRVLGILVESNITNRLIEEFVYRNYDYGVYGGNYRSGVRELERITIAGIEYFKIDYIRTFDAPDNGNVAIIFTENPGDTEGDYRIWGLCKETFLASSAIELTVKPPFDYEYLLPSTLLLIQGFKDGDFLNKHAEVIALGKKYRKELSKGEQGNWQGSEDRGF